MTLLKPSQSSCRKAPWGHIFRGSMPCWKKLFCACICLHAVWEKLQPPN